MGDVELPAFIGLFGLEADIAAFRAFVRLGSDKASCYQDPPDRRYRGADTVALLEVKRDRGCAGLMPWRWRCLRSATISSSMLGRCGPGCDAVFVGVVAGRVALGEVALNEGDHPPSRDPVVAGNLAFTASFDQYGRNHQLRHSHRSTLVVGCERCPETGVNDLVNSGTSATASAMSRDIVHMCLGTSFTVLFVVGSFSSGRVGVLAVFGRRWSRLGCVGRGPGSGHWCRRVCDPFLCGGGGCCGAG